MGEMCNEGFMLCLILYETEMHSVYKTGQIVFLFPSAGLLLV